MVIVMVVVMMMVMVDDDDNNNNNNDVDASKINPYTLFIFIYQQGIKKTDNYAFLQMEDESSLNVITHDAVRLFGIKIKVHQQLYHDDDDDDSDDGDDGDDDDG